MHLLWNGNCFPLDCELSYEKDYAFQLSKLGLKCISDTELGGLIATLGYWFANGFQHYVVSCPYGHCNSTFHLRDPTTLIYTVSR